VAQELLKMGFSKVYALKGGWNEWYKAEYPVEKR
jgi:3-mercaptopyruvate sulfurtransferase SseA